MFKNLREANKHNNDIFKCLWFGHKWNQPINQDGIIVIQCNRCYKIKGKL